VSIYSRNSEDNTAKYPDVAAAVLAGLAPGVRSLVIDAEVVAIERASGKLLPFQVLAGRKKVADPAAPGAPVALFAFDALHLNGATLLDQPLSARRAALQSALILTPGTLDLAVGSTTQDPDELAAFLDAAVAGGTEGLIVKGGASTYEPSRRSTHWLKLKKDYLDGVGDTFDVVPIGAWHGRGKRQGVYGAYLLAVYDEEGEEFQTISKIGTGFSEEALETLSSGLAPHVIAGPRPYYRYGETCVPDVWFEPAAVWEVKAADLSLSPVHQAAVGKADPGRGISIRFPRLVRVREDKAPEQATSAEQVAEMYARQVTVAAQAGAGGNGGGGEDDIY
jgi:DNA ligase-1